MQIRSFETEVMQEKVKSKKGGKNKVESRNWKVKGRTIKARMN
jgi:hypothetical protein